MSLQAFRTRIHILTALADFPIQVLLKMFGFFFTVLWCKGIRISKHRFLCVFKNHTWNWPVMIKKNRCAICEVTRVFSSCWTHFCIDHPVCLDASNYYYRVYSLVFFHFLINSFWHFYFYFFIYSIRVCFFLIPVWKIVPLFEWNINLQDSPIL